MKKLTRCNLERMRQELFLLDENAQRRVLGGTNSCSHGMDMAEKCPLCEGFDVVSWEEYFRQEESGLWGGGWHLGFDGKPHYSYPSCGATETERITGYCKEHGIFFGNECRWLHNGHGDEYCEDHHYWYNELMGCGQCDHETVTGYCEKHNEQWEVSEGLTGFCSVCGPEGSSGGSGSGSGSGSSSGNPDKNPGLNDGVDVTNSKHFTFNTSGYENFDSELKKMLGSNSVLKNILSYFDEGYVHLTFDIADMKNGDVQSSALAHTNCLNQEVFHITFNENYIDESGWNKIIRRDNIGYDWGNVQNTEEALVVVVTHEALHAKHMAVYYDAYREGGKSTNGIAQYLTDRNYDREFVEIFCVQKSEGEWDHNSWEVIEKKLHEYMGKHDYGVIDAALKEYREDHNVG